MSLKRFGVIGLKTKCFSSFYNLKYATSENFLTTRTQN